MDKIIIVGHSYHQKTKSNSFIIELLNQKYDVELLYDDSWSTGEEPDVSFIDERYKAVIFWQNISVKMLSSITCKNIIFFPMYDAVYHVGDDYWYNFRNLKIICFSYTLYKKLEKLSFNTIYIQYFPYVDDFQELDEISIFFWQRRSEITWNTVKELFEKEVLDSVHIHKAVDPLQEFLHPTEEDEKFYNITFSDWFETKEHYYDIMKSKSIYIAPRLYEGIGFSFLEAMAMGKIVIAADNPTMNEYIVHGKNGFLFDVMSPKPIKIDDIKKIQKNAYDTVNNGRRNWDENKHKIIDFIKKPIINNHRFSIRFRVNAWIGKFKLISKRILRNAAPYGFIWIYRKYIKGINEPF
jgi:glycosyltransferase involved in cell wall biosynthesis